MPKPTAAQRRVEARLRELARDALLQHLAGLRRSRLRTVEYHDAAGMVAVLRADAIQIAQRLAKEGSNG